MKIVLRFTDSEDEMDIEDFSEEKRKEILKKSIGETKFGTNCQTQVRR